jgi:hypothetical protein
MTTAREPPSAYGFLMSWCVSLRIRRVAVKNPSPRYVIQIRPDGICLNTCLEIVTSRKRGDTAQD